MYEYMLHYIKVIRIVTSKIFQNILLLFIDTLHLK